MKNLYLIVKSLIIILSCFTFQKVNCQIDTISLASQDLKGKIKSVENKTYSAKENLGTVLKVKELSKNANFKIQLENSKTSFFCEYNKKGKSIKQMIFHKDLSLTEIKIFEYKNGLINKSMDTLLGPNLAIPLLHQYVYNSNKNLIKIKLYRFGDLFQKTLFEYDKNNKILKEKVIDNKGDIDKRKIYSYRNNKLIFKKDTSNISSDEDSFKYDSNENLIYKSSKLGFGNDTNDILIINTEYFYNNDNQLIKKVFIVGKLKTTISYKYNSNGKLSSVVTKKANNGFLETKKFTYGSDKSKTVEIRKNNESITKKYNKFKNPVYYQHSKGNNNIEYSYKYFYDNVGNWTKIIEFKNTIPNKIRIRKIKYY